MLPVANGIALVFTIVMNYLSNTGLFNGNTMKTISDKYANYFTPAGYAFSIWGLIYLGLIAFVCYTGRSLFRKDANDEILQKIGGWFLLSCLANSLWVVAWLYDYTGASVLIMAVLLLSLVKIVTNTHMQVTARLLADKAFVIWPFALYIGWVSVAFVANTAAFLTKISWNRWGIDEVVWTVVMIGVAGLINILMVGYRRMFAFGMVGIWALAAIAVANREVQQERVIIYACYIAIGLILLSILATLISHRLHPVR